MNQLDHKLSENISRHSFRPCFLFFTALSFGNKFLRRFGDFDLVVNEPVLMRDGGDDGVILASDLGCGNDRPLSFLGSPSLANEGVGKWSLVDENGVGGSEGGSDGIDPIDATLLGNESVASSCLRIQLLGAESCSFQYAPDGGEMGGRGEEEGVEEVGEVLEAKGRISGLKRSKESSHLLTNNRFLVPSSLLLPRSPLCSVCSHDGASSVARNSKLSLDLSPGASLFALRDDESAELIAVLCVLPFARVSRWLFK